MTHTTSEYDCMIIISGLVFCIFVVSEFSSGILKHNSQYKIVAYGDNSVIM